MFSLPGLNQKEIEKHELINYQQENQIIKKKKKKQSKQKLPIKVQD